MEGPRLINSGKEAMVAVAQVLPKSQALRVQTSQGPVDLKPGTIWNGNRMLVTASPSTVVYAIDDRLYEWGTGAFIRDEWLNALSLGASRASHWVTIAQIEVALLPASSSPGTSYLV
jgi:hypothetical protein